MLSKRYRLPLRERQNFFDQAQRFYSPLFTIFYQKDDTQNHAQAAVVVPKKVNKRAVVRNKVKRQFLTILSQLLPQYQKLQVVVIVKPEAVVAKNDMKEKKFSRNSQPQNSQPQNSQPRNSQHRQRKQLSAADQQQIFKELSHFFERTAEKS